MKEIKSTKVKFLSTNALLHKFYEAGSREGLFSDGQIVSPPSDAKL